MATRTVEGVVGGVYCLKYELAVGGIGAKLLPDPLELVERTLAEVFPLHTLLRADLGPGTPTPAVGTGKTAFTIGQKIPEMLGGTEIAHTVIARDVPHELPEEVADRHLAEGESGETVPQIDLDGLAEDLFVAQSSTTYDLGAFREDLSGDLDVLEIE